MAQFNPQSILVYTGGVEDNAIGENFIKLPFLRAIREAYPEAKISWAPCLGKAQFEGILAPMVEGQIDEIITDLFLTQEGTGIVKFGNPMPGRSFDLIFDFQKSLSRTLQLRRIPHKKFISGTWRFFFSSGKPPKGVKKPSRLVDKLLYLASAAIGEMPRPSHIAPIPDRFIKAAKEMLPDGKIYVALSPGAGRRDTGKCWPLENFIAVARDQAQKGRVPVFITGPDEADWMEILRKEVPEAIFPLNDLVPEGMKPEPTLTVALGRRLAAAVANCAGAGHMMAAGGAPMVSLFAPTSPKKFGPYTPDIVILRGQDFGSDKIEAIPVDQVIEAVDRLVEKGREG